MRVLGMVCAVAIVVASVPVALAGTDVRELADAIVADLGLTPMECFFIPLHEREKMVSVCARPNDSFKNFERRWESSVSAMGVRPTSDWIRRKTGVFYRNPRKTYYRHYEHDGQPFFVFFDQTQQRERILIAQVPSPVYEPPDEEAEDDPPAGDAFSNDEISLPEIVGKVTPEYPWLARMLRTEGRVILQAIVDTDGSVADLEVLAVNREGLGFEAAAMAAIKRWRYSPATLKGEPVAVYFTIRADFELE